jgi:hypothetical protein
MIPMGMDVNGIDPDAQVGEYYRGQWDDWHALAHCICALAPSETAPCKGWHYNDGDGLNAEESIALADKLDRCLKDGSVDAYIADRDAPLKKASAVRCRSCGLAVFRGLKVVVDGEWEPDTPTSADDGANRGAAQFGSCVCGKRVLEIPNHSRGDLSANGVRRFVEFVRHSGGFSIW